MRWKVPKGIKRGLPHRFKIKTFKWYPCPGCIADPIPGFKKFDRWHKRTEKVRLMDRPDPSKVYWRMHPKAYARMTRGKSPV